MLRAIFRHAICWPGTTQLIYLRLNSIFGNEDEFIYLQIDAGEYQEVNPRSINWRF